MQLPVPESELNSSMLSYLPPNLHPRNTQTTSQQGMKPKLAPTSARTMATTVLVTMLALRILIFLVLINVPLNPKTALRPHRRSCPKPRAHPVGKKAGELGGLGFIGA